MGGGGWEGGRRSRRREEPQSSRLVKLQDQARDGGYYGRSWSRLSNGRKGDFPETAPGNLILFGLVELASACGGALISSPHPKRGEIDVAGLLG